MKFYPAPPSPDIITEKDLDFAERFWTGNMTDEEKEKTESILQRIKKAIENYEKVETKTNERGGI